MTLESLKQSYEKCMEKADSFVDQFPWESKQAYMTWLAQSYYFVRHSTRLLAMAAAHSPIGDDTLHRRMLEHIGEEIGHEIIAANDIKQLGHSITGFLELNETKAFYRNQYFHVQQYGSVAFLGYVLMLEGLAATKGNDILKRISAVHGDKACNFVRVHADLDQGHVQSAFNLVENSNPNSFEMIENSLVESCRFYQQMMEEVAFTLTVRKVGLPKQVSDVSL